ncbi:MAG: hypothetical protein ACTHU0_32655 [Kofleriaceae bacterium]
MSGVEQRRRVAPSAPGAPTPPPPLSANQLEQVLHDLIYERVLGLIDLDALFRFEQELWLVLGRIGLDDDRIGELADELVARSLRRAAEDPRRHMVLGRAEVVDGDDCELCRQLEREDQTSRH